MIVPCFGGGACARVCEGCGRQRGGRTFRVASSAPGVCSGGGPCSGGRPSTGLPGAVSVQAAATRPGAAAAVGSGRQCWHWPRLGAPRGPRPRTPSPRARHACARGAQRGASRPRACMCGARGTDPRARDLHVPRPHPDWRPRAHDAHAHASWGGAALSARRADSRSRATACCQVLELSPASSYSPTFKLQGSVSILSWFRAELVSPQIHPD